MQTVKSSTDRPNRLRRHLVTGAPVFLLVGGCTPAAQAKDLVVYKTPYCGCCTSWVAHMSRAGFKTTVVEVEDLNPMRLEHGIPAELSSCHTALIGGYVVEGHVPAGDVARLLREKPKAVGIVVPGMPIGSPGMEDPGGRTEPYRTLLLLDASGKTTEFARHG